MYVHNTIIKTIFILFISTYVIFYYNYYILIANIILFCNKFLLLLKIIIVRFFLFLLKGARVYTHARVHTE